jgi:hypothetical protein
MVLAAGLAGCHWGIGTVNGNGNIVTEKRSVAGFSEVSVAGPFEVVITPGDGYGVSVETDENLMQYVNFDKDGRRLKVKVRRGVNIRSRHGIKVQISMPEVHALSFAGSGKIRVNGVLESDRKIEFDVAGSGDIEAAVHCPRVEADIAGSGSIQLQGETRDASVDIAGSGDFKAGELRSETVVVNIAGSGNAQVFASTKLKVSIAGSGDVLYKGNPGNVEKSIAGSGRIKPL